MKGRGRPAEQADVRRGNLSLVLRRLREAGPRSRARLSEETGLTKATISSLVADLVERGLLRRGSCRVPASRGGPGSRTSWPTGCTASAPR
jgi:Uncharacterized membrane-associated protein/domain